jgi:uncharacterized protein (DUF983 family)
MRDVPGTRGAFWQGFRRGWQNRCPRCGEGRIWKNGSDLYERCGVCSLQFEHDRASWGGFMWAFLLEGILIAIGSPLVELFADLSFLQHVYLWTAFTVAFHVMFYRQMKGQWIGMRWAFWDRTEERPRT